MVDCGAYGRVIDPLAGDGHDFGVKVDLELGDAGDILDFGSDRGAAVTAIHLGDRVGELLRGLAHHGSLSFALPSVCPLRVSSDPYFPADSPA